MKTTSRTIVVASLVAVAIGCGLGLGGEEATESTDAGSEDQFAPSTSSGATASDGSGASLLDSNSGADGTSTTSGDARAVDAGAGVSFPEGGPSHGTMGCPPASDAAAPCDLTSNVCCTCPNCFAPYPTTCFPTLTGCVGVVFSGVYARLTCGDSTNCAPGWRCCAEFDSTSALTASACLASCPSPGSLQLCTSNAQCPAGTSCGPLASAPGFSACQ